MQSINPYSDQSISVFHLHLIQNENEKKAYNLHICCLLLPTAGSMSRSLRVDLQIERGSEIPSQVVCRNACRDAF